MKASVIKALQNLSDQGGVDTFIKVLSHGSMSVELYLPIDIDHQTPHTQDELYVIVSGNGELYMNGITTPCELGDILFVPAGAVHRFENFTSDFATWVIFYGPAGGE